MGKTFGCRISFRSNFRFPGKLIRVMPINIVKSPCPGMNSITKPAIRKISPRRFFSNSNVKRISGCRRSKMGVRSGVTKYSADIRIRITGISKIVPKKVSVDSDVSQIRIERFSLMNSVIICVVI